MNGIERYRDELNRFMKHQPQSPISHEDRGAFEELSYFAYNLDLEFEADVHLFGPDEPKIKMSTNTGDVRAYSRWGTFAFEVEGQSVELVIYGDASGDDLFLPFRDSTNGNESYGAGRYLDNHRPGIVVLSEKRVALNFNYAYNPYCAYSELFSCPLPPRENWLNVPIAAGEMRFK